MIVEELRTRNCELRLMQEKIHKMTHRHTSLVLHTYLRIYYCVVLKIFVVVKYQLVDEFVFHNQPETSSTKLPP